MDQLSAHFVGMTSNRERIVVEIDKTTFEHLFSTTYDEYNRDRRPSPGVKLSWRLEIQQANESFSALATMETLRGSLLQIAERSKAA